MANPEHLKILKQGVKAWNKWREENPDIKVDLSGADLLGADLNGANLCGAKLSRARLWKGKLRAVDLKAADLYRAILWEADLTEADLGSAYLYNADLYTANARRANMEEADLRFCDLNRTNFTGAVLTGVRFYGTARDDWKIKGVRCRYVYWDAGGAQRSPKDRDLEPGEFERLYAALPTIEYIFEHGMTPIDPLIMDRVVQVIREKKPDFDIKIDSINARGLAPSIKFTVQHEEHKELALKEVGKQYEGKLKQLESERDRYYRLVSRALDAPREAKLTIVESGAIAALDGSTINIEHINYALELQRAIAAEPEKSERFAKVAKKTALDIIGGAIKDIAKGQVKEAAKQIIELGKDLAPLFVRMAPAAYEFFKNMIT